MDEALDFILTATKLGSGSEIFIPKIKAYSIVDIKNTLFDLIKKTDDKITGIRPGEKLHEVLINPDEMKYTWEVGNVYVILNPLEKLNKQKRIYPKMKKIESLGVYSSDNVDKLSKSELKNLIKKSGLV